MRSNGVQGAHAEGDASQGHRGERGRGQWQDETGSGGVGEGMMGLPIYVHQGMATWLHKGGCSDAGGCIVWRGHMRLGHRWACRIRSKGRCHIHRSAVYPSVDDQYWWCTGGGVWCLVDLDKMCRIEQGHIYIRNAVTLHEAG